MKIIYYFLRAVAILYNIWMLCLFARPKFERVIAKSAYLSRLDASLFEKSVRLVSFITVLRKG